MQKEMAVLIRMLRCFNSNLKNPPLEDAQLSLAESISLTIPLFENKIALLLTEMESRNDYCELDQFLTELYVVMHQYLLDLERFEILWLEMRGAYCQQKSVDESFVITFDKFTINDNLMNDNIQRIVNIIIKLNKLDCKRIISEEQIKEVKELAVQLPKIITKLRTFIHAFVNREKNDKESLAGYLFYIGGKMQDYSSRLKFIEEALHTIMEKHSDKADKSQCID